MIKKLFILSTKAGKGNFIEFKEKIIEVYEKNNRLEELEIVLTEDKEHGRRAALEFSKKKFPEKIVIGCGGDGTIGELAGVLHGTDTSLGLIPMGTGNDFSKNFDYTDFKIEDTFYPFIKPIDLIEVNDKICINVMSLGFDTQVLKNTYEFLKLRPKMGKRAFIYGIIKSLLDVNHEDLEFDLVLANGENVKVADTYTITALCNGAFYGSGFNPAPSSLLDDGVLNLIAIEKLSLITMPPLIMRYKKGTHMDYKKVNEYLVKSGTITSKKNFFGNTDGEIFETDRVEFKVIEKGINWAYFDRAF